MCELKKRSLKTAERQLEKLKKSGLYWQAKAGLGLARIRLAQGRKKEARDEAMKSVKLVRSAEGALFITRLALDAKRVKTAAKWADRAEKLSPGEPAATAAQAFVAAAAGNSDDALKILQTAEYSYPKSCIINLVIAQVAAGAGLHDRVIRNTDKTIDHCPEMEEAYLLRGSAALMKSDKKAARKNFKLFTKYGGDPKLVKDK